LAKKLIDRSKSEADKPIPPFQLNVKVEPILQFIAALSHDDKDDADQEGGLNLKALAETLAQAPGKDHVRVEYIPQPGGGTIRLSAEEGVLRLLGAVLQNAQLGGVIPGFGS